MTLGAWHTAEALALRINGTLYGDASMQISGVHQFDGAMPNHVTFYAEQASASSESLTSQACVVTTPALRASITANCIIEVPDPRRSFVSLVELFHPQSCMPAGTMSPLALVDSSASVDPTAAIGPGCVVGANCTIGSSVQLVANVVLYQDCTIGSGTVVHANVVCREGTTVGEQCLIHSGVVIGADGFGYLGEPDGSFTKVPQVGVVTIGNNVEIGANTTIDRAALGETRIEDGVKIDNLVHLAHGVSIGNNTAIAAQTGISGSTKIGQRNRIAGQVGIVGHIELANDVVVYAQSGVGKSISAPGAYFGSPAKDHATALRIEAVTRRLPELDNELQQLRRELHELTKRS